ncbi:hypothetical protein OIU91_10270 [Streptomyces sp. NBC_01456]
MSVIQEYLLDAYRARTLGNPTPPAPGTSEWRLAREVRGYWQFRAVLRSARGRGRWWDGR